MLNREGEGEIGGSLCYERERGDCNEREKRNITELTERVFSVNRVWLIHHNTG